MTIDQVFTPLHLYHAYKKSRRNVGWKKSVQTYRIKALILIQQDIKRLHKGTYKPKPFYEFDRSERGKTRHIKSNTFNDRVLQKCFCDYYLTPLLKSKLIYDNGATLKHKGCDFTKNRIIRHLKALQKEKPIYECYALVMDFHSYFDLINHLILLQLVEKHCKDQDLFLLFKQWVDAFGDIGLGLGSQISQLCAVFYTNELDQFIKRTLKCKYYGRYMDDSYILHPNKDFLKYCLQEILKICDRLHIVMNPKKTQIIKLSKGLPILQRIYKQKGHTVQSIPQKKSGYRMVRKIKTFVKWVNEGRMRPEAIYDSFQSWQSHLRYDTGHRLLNYTRKRCIKYIANLKPEIVDSLSPLWNMRIMNLVVF